MSSETTPPVADEPAPKTARLDSIDAYRGLVMFLMMAEALRLGAMAKNFPESKVWKFLAEQQSHVEWVGCVVHDMIQPSFSFLVGVALPFSIASRAAKGQSKRQMTLHALWRGLVLVLLGVFLRSVGKPQTNWTFEDTLSQIGLGYPILFWLGWQSRRVQGGALAAILLGYWLLFAAYPAPGTDFDFPAHGVAADWPHHPTGFAAHWDKNSNPAWAFDHWFLNLFPREKAFEYNRGGYATLSFIPTLATMLLGLLAGQALREQRPSWNTVGRLVLAGVVATAAGWGLGAVGACPVVKRIWTPSWTLYSGGLCFLILAGFYTVMDILGWKGWAFPLRVIGMNSIAAYVLAHLVENFITEAFRTHLGSDVFQAFGAPYEPFVRGVGILSILWLILFWMYRRQLFLKV
ncbi:acyltransferase family protein [Paludisphaera rhizosphaerae]|uniref:acyltransferase family protein n=1 Tax=Paludisphaera rhizosphaerae TaxID=2711216 RepID=UPI001F113B07|nr:DUF5009 domain-containing protein [Paludisphaera rhizosphaerae]